LCGCGIGSGGERCSGGRALAEDGGVGDVGLVDEEVDDGVVVADHVFLHGEGVVAPDFGPDAVRALEFMGDVPVDAGGFGAEGQAEVGGGQDVEGMGADGCGGDLVEVEVDGDVEDIGGGGVGDFGTDLDELVGVGEGVAEGEGFV